MLKPRELWQLVNTLCILNILGGKENEKTVNDIKNLCNLLQYMSREAGLFSNGYISYISIGRYAKYVDLHFMNGSIYNFDSYTKAFLYDQLLRYAKTI